MCECGPLVLLMESLSKQVCHIVFTRPVLNLLFFFPVHLFGLIRYCDWVYQGWFILAPFIYFLSSCVCVCVCVCVCAFSGLIS